MKGTALEYEMVAERRDLITDFTVGEWRVSRAINRIERRGHAISLEPLAMDVLVYLATRRGDVVSIDELITTLWQGRATDGSVYRTINHVRRALEGDNEEPCYIQTIRKRGYRLIAKVDFTTPSDGFDLAGAPLTAPPRTSIAVLPFENLSVDRENAFFADGMHGEVLSQLAKISSLRVISRTSVLEYRLDPKNVRKIARELRVGTILEGTVQRSAGSARINVQLIDAERDEHVWAHVYDRKLSAENILTIQSEIATAVAAALHAALLPHEAARLKRVPTTNAAAYDCYLSGNALQKSANFDLMAKRWLGATEAYERAVQHDAKFAPAWTALSRMHSLLFHAFIDRTKSRIAAAFDALERARQLDPDMPEFHLAAGEYYFRSKLDCARALAEYDLAARGMPDAPELLFARALVYKRLGRWEQAFDTFEQAALLDPRNTRLIFNQADTYMKVREFEVANACLDQVLALDPSFAYAHVWRAAIALMRDGDVTTLKNAPVVAGGLQHALTWTAALYERNCDTACRALNAWESGVCSWPHFYMLKDLAYGVTYDLWGRAVDAKRSLLSGRAQVEEMLAKNSDDPRLFIALGEALAALDEPEAAKRAAREALAMRPKSMDAHLGLVYQIDAVMRVLIRAGAIDEAIAALDDYLGTRGAAWTIEGLLPDPRLDRIRDDPRFVALVDKHRRR